jgi:hypothetical protein|tara:strand:- start:116 stop:316 length:201 start_codon:yes stop_codon:yes gene_type:complete
MSYFEIKHKCESCKKDFDIEEGYLDIQEICYADDEQIKQYEIKHDIDFTNFFCEICAMKTLKSVEI